MEYMNTIFVECFVERQAVTEHSSHGCCDYVCMAGNRSVSVVN